MTKEGLNLQSSLVIGGALVGHSSLTHSFAACRRVTLSANSSFPHAFRLLPQRKRLAMDALYAFMRVTDDLADEPAELSQKQRKLAAWRAGLHSALAGEFTHPIHPALVDTVRRYAIPPQFLFDAIEGMETDLGPVRLATFAELSAYCYRVASTVGLACVRVWETRPGVTHAETDPLAEAAGIAFQFTNILRDLGEDLARDRVYLPADELARFDCPPESWRDPASVSAFRALMQFQIERARDYYRQSESLASKLSTEGRAIFRVMHGVYRRLLDEIERRGYDVFTRRVRIAKWRKVLVCASGWLAKWGLL